MDRRNRSTVSNTIRASREKKLIEGDKAKGYVLTRTGYQAATEMVKAKSDEAGSITR